MSDATHLPADRLGDIRSLVDQGRTYSLSTLAGIAGMLLAAGAGCTTRGELIRVKQENRVLRDTKERLERTVADRDGTIARLHRQVRTLEGFGPDRPADLFAPVKLQIASLTGGADYDGKPGDDGVTVHLRPRDADGDVVKAPGRFRIQLLDNSEFGSPRVLGIYVFNAEDELRRAWHGKLGTNHYTFKCPFPPGVELPLGRRVVVDAEFVDYLTGTTLTAVKEVRISLVDEPQ